MDYTVDQVEQEIRQIKRELENRKAAATGPRVMLPPPQGRASTLDAKDALRRDAAAKQIAAKRAMAVYKAATQKMNEAIVAWVNAAERLDP